MGIWQVELASYGGEQHHERQQRKEDQFDRVYSTSVHSASTATNISQAGNEVWSFRKLVFTGSSLFGIRQLQ
jgi:hypothetical protein